MGQVRQLYELQEIDLDLDGKRQALARVESQIGESEALTRAREGLEAENHRVAQLERKQREAEWQVDDLQVKITPLRTKLYSGEVKSPKELTNLQREVEQLEAQRGSLEDRVLESMVQVDVVHDAIKEKRRELVQIEEEWRHTQEQLSKEQAGLKSELSALEQRRSLMLARIDPKDVELYQVLREGKQGRAIAKVEQGMCQGCRITLPLAVLQRTREGEELVQCSSCGRILYVG